MSETPKPIQINARLAPVWLIGWLFTIGYCDLDFARILAAILVWPYFLGKGLS